MSWFESKWFEMAKHIILAALIPLIALALQWTFWHEISPFVWFLFFPAVFFSARFNGFWCGILSTLISTAIVWYFFIPPPSSVGKSRIRTICILSYRS